MTSLMRLITCLTAFSLLAACSAKMPRGPQPGDPAYAPVNSSYNQPLPVANGAIYQAYQSPSFFSDRKARRLGDIITINLIESTSASKQADTEIKKNSSVGVAEPTLFQRINDIGLETDISSQNNFKGEADSDQSNSLQGSISVTVTEVLNNGVLRVSGEKWITLNRGDEFIRITGLVRPDDIQSDNSVDSSQIADARIAYSQTGDLANANSMGWLTRFFNSSYWPL